MVFKPLGLKALPKPLKKKTPDVFRFQGQFYYDMFSHDTWDSSPFPVDWGKNGKNGPEGKVLYEHFVCLLSGWFDLTASSQSGATI